MIDTQFTSALRAAVSKVLPLVVLVGLAACTPTTTVTRPQSGQNLELRARAAVEAGNLAAASDLYTQLAATVPGTQRSGFLLEAARLAADFGDTALARRRLNDARGSATREQQQTIAVLLARLELADRRPQAALDLLAALQQPLSPAALSDAAAVRGQALFALGRPADAVRALTEREVWLEDAPSILANQRLIWEGLRQLPPSAPLAPTGDRIVDGWLALAPLAASGTTDLRRALLGWRQTYTDHPAAGGWLAELLAQQRSESFPTQIALLLPLSSAQRVAALAIRDGFLAAHLRNPRANATAVRVYDSAQLGSEEAYLRAQLEGADFIVGPLLRPEVDLVIARAGFVPTLTLNFATNRTTFLNSLYQFALAPEDEARVIAAAAAAAGASTAIAFVPSNARGYQIRDNFRAEFEARGGRLLDFSGYEPSLRDFSQPISALLNISRSTQRHRRLAANLGVPVQFEARRRQDVDMIFLVADAQTGRLLVPQLRFFSAGDIPTYATSDIFDPGNSGRENDLNGIIFPDAPSLLIPDESAAQLQRGLQTYWPQRAAQLRLYGLGFDAYQLVGSLYGDSRSPWPLRGMSGDLTLDSQGRIHRSLPLAQFRNGRPVALEAPAPQPSRLVGQN